MSATAAHHPAPARTRLQAGFFRFWKRFCRGVVKVFYRRFEVVGAASIPRNAGVILCANHVNALVDAAIVQAATGRDLRPLARSGLFANPLLKPILDLIGAVPIFRPGDAASDTGRNQDSFRRCHELLDANEALIIFPEGQSHSDPHLRELKTGAARLALGALRFNRRAPVVIPAGLTFSRKGNFRGEVLVHFGAPVDLIVPPDADEHEAVRVVTQRLRDGLEAVTLNAESWADHDLVTRLERFFALRHNRHRSENLAQRFRAQHRLIEAQRVLRAHEPERVRRLMTQLKAFERVCNCCGIRDYHLTVQYRPALMALYVAHVLGVVLVGLPAAAWGVINSALPFLLTRHLARRIARGLDQYDTTKILLGALLFTLFWTAQTWLVWREFGAHWGIGYLLSIIAGAIVALRLRGERRRIRENLRVFFLFLRKRRLKAYLQIKRRDLERELARLVRIAKRLPRVAQA